MADGTRPPGRAARHLRRALRAVDCGPRPFFRAALLSLAVTSVLAMTIAWVKRPAGAASLPAPQRDMIAGALAALCLSVALGIASLALERRHPAVPDASGRLDHIVGPRERAAIWLALAAWFPFLLIVVYYRAAATFGPSVEWLRFGFTDKRWVSAAYLLGALAPMIWLTAAARVLAIGRGHPATWRAWFAGLFSRTAAATAPDTREAVDTPDAAGTQDAAGTRGSASDSDTPHGPDARDGSRGGTVPGWRHSRAGRTLTVAAGLATALALAWYFFGPPWYLTQNSSVIGAQEDIWLNGLQAISRGHLSYIGVAGVQYGPGTQFATYVLMRHVTSFSVVGFREAWAVFQWAGASILFAVFFLAFGYARGLAASLLSVLVYPALHQIGFQPGSSFDGFWGWANPLRYAGVIAVVLLLPPIVRRSPSWAGAAAGAAIGVLWGLTSYLAQENLIAGAVGALVVAALLLLSGTSSWRAVRAALVATLGGFAVVWLPILAFYAVHGDLGQFLRLYFLLARAMAQGFGNTWWQGATHWPSPLTTMFYALPFLLAVLALLTVFMVRPVRIAAGWSRDRVRFAATVVITILLYQGALLRSDTVDLTGTLLTVPCLVVMAASELPRLLGGTRRLTVTLAGATLALASFALLPYHAYAWGSVRAEAQAPYLDRQRLAADPAPARPASLAASRVGAGLDVVPVCCQGSRATMADFIAVMNRLHAIIGTRTAYVADVPHGYPGLVYFTADLTPAPVMADKYMTVLDEPQLVAYMAYFAATVLPQTQAVVTASLAAPEAQFFLQRYPDARQVTLRLDGAPYYVLLREG